MLSQNFQVNSDYACDICLFLYVFRISLSLYKGITNMLNDSLESGLTNICLSYAYFFSTSEPEYAYKRYAYKKKHVL